MRSISSFTRRMRWLMLGSILLWSVLLTSCGSDSLTAISPTAMVAASPDTAAAVEHHHAPSSTRPATTSTVMSTLILPTATITSTVAPALPPPTATIKLSGSGEQASASFALKAGLALFHYDHPTTTPFGMFLMNARGDHLALLANGAAIGGTQVYGIPADDDYYLHVIAQDSWSASVEQPQVEDLSQRAEPLDALDGNGPAVSAPLRLSAGQLRLSWQQRGTLPFEIVLWDVAGPRQIQVLSASMDAEGAATIEVPDAGVYVLNVQASGPWTIALDGEQR